MSVQAFLWNLYVLGRSYRSSATTCWKSRLLVSSQNPWDGIRLCCCWRCCLFLRAKSILTGCPYLCLFEAQHFFSKPLNVGPRGRLDEGLGMKEGQCLCELIVTSVNMLLHAYVTCDAKFPLSYLLCGGSTQNWLQSATRLWEIPCQLLSLSYRKVGSSPQYLPWVFHSFLRFRAVSYWCTSASPWLKTFRVLLSPKQPTWLEFQHVCIDKVDADVLLVGVQLHAVLLCNRKSVLIYVDANHIRSKYRCTDAKRTL